ncbi:MAG TPA: TetR/AcrR family transcriptional regulator [Gaiellaceae bacterium]|nr:TetR/AcrR family transcriptional regulator [Gaiellaceae bacterium]
MTDRSVTAEEKRRLILDAAVRVFARKGFHTCRVGDISEEAGVAHGLLYHYFSSKDELLEAVFRETWSDLLAAIREVEVSDAPAREQLRQVAAIMLRAWRRQPDLVRVLVREVARSPALLGRVDALDDALTAIGRIVERGQDEGNFRPDLDPRLASLVFYGGIETILTSWVLGRGGDDEDVARAERAVVEVVCAGLTREPAMASP